MRTLATTMQETISLGNGSLAGLMNGESTEKAKMKNRLWGNWGFYALWLPEWFDTLATANADEGMGLVDLPLRASFLPSLAALLIKVKQCGSSTLVKSIRPNSGAAGSAQRALEECSGVLRAGSAIWPSGLPFSRRACWGR